MMEKPVTKRVGPGKLIFLFFMLVEDEQDMIRDIMAMMELEEIEALGKKARELLDMATAAWKRKKAAAL